MVYSAELGYDPEEWEECPPPDHFLAFGWFTRLVLAAGAIAFAFLFFYVLERKKGWSRDERRASFAEAAGVRPEELDELIARTKRERSESSQRRFVPTLSGTSQAAQLSIDNNLHPFKRPKKRMSENDMAALIEWERGLKETEESRLEEAKKVDQRFAPSLRASAPPQQYQYQNKNGSFENTPPPTMRPIESLRQEEQRASSSGKQSLDSPIRAKTPPSTPPGGPPIPPHASQLQAQYEHLAEELSKKLSKEIQNEDGRRNAQELQEQLYKSHEATVLAAENAMRNQGAAGEQAAQQFRRNFENQIDTMVEDYHRRLNRADTQAHSSNESDVEPFEQIGGSPAMFCPSESDDPENEATSFTYEASPKSHELGESKHTKTTVITHQQAAHVPELLVNDRKMPPADNKQKSSSSSEEGFVKIYSGLVEKIDEEVAQSARAEAQLKEILREYDEAPTATIKLQKLEPQTSTHLSDTAAQESGKESQVKKQSSKDRKSKSKSKSKSPSPRHSPTLDELFPIQPQPQVQVPLVPLAGFQGNFLQQYQQGPDGRLYAQGPDGLFYAQNKKGQLIPISADLQDILQNQQQSGLQQPLIKTLDGKLYQQGANGQFYEQMESGQMYKVPPNVQVLIQQEIQQTLQIGERKPTEPADIIKANDGSTYEKGPLGQFYEQGPDGKLHRVSPEIQRQLLDLVEEQKQESEKQKEREASATRKPSIDPYQKRPSASNQSDPPIIQSPDGKIYELASDGNFYQLAGDGRMYRIPYEMQPLLHKQHKKFMEQKQKHAAERPKSSIEEDTPPFDPEYPYHPRRRQPMQPSPNAKDDEDASKDPRRPELKRQQQNEQTPPIVIEEPPKPKPLESKDVHQVKELLQEYDLSTSIETPHSHYDQPQHAIETPKRDEREHRPSPEDLRQKLQTPDTKTGHTTPDSALDFDLLQMPGEVEAELRSHPSPSQSSGQTQQKHIAEIEHDEYRSATQPPIAPAGKTQEPKVHRDASEQSHKQRAQQIYLEQNEDPRRLVEADIYLQDAIDYVDNQQQQDKDRDSIPSKQQSGFVMEEDMLLSSSDKLPLKMQNASADPTSRLVATNDVFEKPEPINFDDADDAVTFAPDIQTVEIPPDQVSQNSSNYLIDNLPDETFYPDALQVAKDKQQDEFAPNQPLNDPLLPQKTQEPVEIPKSLPASHPKPSSPIEAENQETAYAPKHTAPSQYEHHRISIQHPQLHHQEEFDVLGVDNAPLMEPEHVSNPLLVASTTTPTAERDPTQPFHPLSHDTDQRLGPDEARRKSGASEKETESLSDVDMLCMRPSKRKHSTSPFKDANQQTPSAPQFWVRKQRSQDIDNASVTSSRSSRSSRSIQKQSSLLSALGCTSIQEMLLGLTSIEELSEAMRKAGLERTNLIFGIDYTASNKYQGEHSFDGRSLHCIDDPKIENPYQQVIKIMGRSLAPFVSSSSGTPVYGFGDNESGDWGVFPLNGTTDGVCRSLKEVLRVYNEITPSIALGGPTNFAPLIYQAIQICQRVQDYHILVIIADGQVTNERATRKAIVQACQFPLSIIVVGVGDGPWDMMKVFDESLPKRPWDNFHFVEYHQLVKSPNDKSGELAFAIHTLLEIPDQYHHVVKLGMLPSSSQHRYSTPQKDSPSRF